MKLRRREFLRLSTLAVAAPAVMRSGWAQAFPSQVVHLIVPTTPGGVADTMARIFADRIGPIWGRQVIVENRPGAGNNIASEYVAHARADGHTILIGGPAMAANRHIYKSLNYDSVKDFAPVTLIGSFANVFIVPKNSPVHSMEEFVAHARRNVGKLNYATPGIGTSQHLTGELLSSVLGLGLVHVAYRGSAQAMQDLLGGRLDMQVAGISTGLVQVRGGEVRALAISSAKRYPAAPEIPTVAETVSPGFDVSSWYGFFVPAGTPDDIVRKIAKDTASAFADADVRRKLQDAAGLVLVNSSPEELKAFLASEIGLWGPVIEKAGLKQD